VFLLNQILSISVVGFEQIPTHPKSGIKLSPLPGNFELNILPSANRRYQSKLYRQVNSKSFIFSA